MHAFYRLVHLPLLALLTLVTLQEAELQRWPFVRWLAPFVAKPQAAIAGRCSWTTERLVAFSTVYFAFYSLPKTVEEDLGQQALWTALTAAHFLRLAADLLLSAAAAAAWCCSRSGRKRD
uniref:Alpha-1,3-glucosyltransferase n=1 Tax=Alexandrium catenella TaxID=2925 RepID=A0A7S1KW21_ALECA